MLKECTGAVSVGSREERIKMGSNSVEDGNQSPFEVLRDAGFDILLYNGRIDYQGFDHVVQQLPDTKRDKVLLVLVTLGGDIDAAYRIVSYLRANYTSVTVLVPGMCKSAGTLICVGAHELVMGERGELGPLDVQVREKGELFSFHSGLAIRQAMESLLAEMRETLRVILVDISKSGGLGTERAADIAIRTTVGAFGPIYGQINPERLGEVDRLVKVAADYASRLHGNLQDGALGTLVLGYSSRSFAIEKDEAETLFKVVRKPSVAENALVRHLGVDKVLAGLLTPETEVRYIEGGSEQGFAEGGLHGEQQAGRANWRDECERRDPQGPAGTVKADQEVSARGDRKASVPGALTTTSASGRTNARRVAEQEQVTPRDSESA